MARGRSTKQRDPLQTWQGKQPLSWSRDEVSQWLQWCIEEYSLSGLGSHGFNMNGKALCMLTKQDFNERLPNVGDVLYNTLHKLSHDVVPAEPLDLSQQHYNSRQLSTQHSSVPGPGRVYSQGGHTFHYLPDYNPSKHPQNVYRPPSQSGPTSDQGFEPHPPIKADYLRSSPQQPQGQTGTDAAPWDDASGQRVINISPDHHSGPTCFVPKDQHVVWTHHGVRPIVCQTQNAPQTFLPESPPIIYLPQQIHDPRLVFQTTTDPFQSEQEAESEQECLQESRSFDGFQTLPDSSNSPQPTYQDSDRSSSRTSGSSPALSSSAELSYSATEEFRSEDDVTMGHEAEQTVTPLDLSCTQSPDKTACNVSSSQPADLRTAGEPTCQSPPGTNSECPLLWEYLSGLLKDPAMSDLIQWLDESELVFKINNPDKLAHMWGVQKHRSNMTYDNLSRALRYYYQMGYVSKVQGKKLTFKFLIPPSQIKKGIRGAKPGVPHKKRPAGERAKSKKASPRQRTSSGNGQDKKAKGESKQRRASFPIRQPVELTERFIPKPNSHDLNQQLHSLSLQQVAGEPVVLRHQFVRSASLPPPCEPSWRQEEAPSLERPHSHPQVNVSMEVCSAPVGTPQQFNPMQL